MTAEHTDSPFVDTERLSGYVDGTDALTWRTYAAEPPAAGAELGISENTGVRERTAQAIQQEVCATLSAEPRFDASRVVVSVSDGEVILEGTVEHARDRDDAEQLTRSINGVNLVHNRLAVEKGLLSELRSRLLGDLTNVDHSGSGTKNAS